MICSDLNVGFAEQFRDMLRSMLTHFVGVTTPNMSSIDYFRFSDNTSNVDTSNGMDRFN
jgi:hypothetical protein